MNANFLLVFVGFFLVIRETARSVLEFRLFHRFECSRNRKKMNRNLRAPHRPGRPAAPPVPVNRGRDQSRHRRAPSPPPAVDSGDANKDRRLMPMMSDLLTDLNQLGGAAGIYNG
jgi:hypothetical protein